MNSGRFYGQTSGSSASGVMSGAPSRGDSEALERTLERILGMLVEQRETAFNTMQQNQQLMMMCENNMGTEVTELKKEVAVLNNNLEVLNGSMATSTSKGKCKM